MCNLSLTGARVALPQAILPDVFDLAVPCRDETRRVRLVWRAGTDAGLRFEGAVADGGGPSGCTAHPGDDEAEATRLRAAPLAAPSDRVH